MRSKIVLTLLWLGFAGLWFRVSQQTRIRDVGTSVALLLGLTALYGVIVGIWVGHNLSLARRRNRRRAAKELALSQSHDYLGLPVEVRSNLLGEQEIEVTIEDGIKRYSSRSREADLLRLHAAARRDGEDTRREVPMPTLGNRR